MPRSSESILEDILSQLHSSSANGINQATADQIAKAMKKALGSQGGAGGSNKSKNKSTASRLADATIGKKDGLLRNTSDVSKHAADGLLQTKSSAESVNLLGESFKSLTGVILPKFAGGITLAVDAAMQFYSFMNQNLEMYKQLNASGLQTTGGMLGLYSSLAQGRLTMESYMNATASTRDVIASMGADGTQQFGKMLDTVIRTQESLGTLNMTNEQAATLLASNLKRQKSYGTFEKLNQVERDNSNRSYMENMSSLSKSLGLSITAMNDKMNKATDSVTGLGTQLALTQRGMDPEQAEKTSNTINGVMGSFGSFGDAINSQLARFIEFGQVDLDSDIGKLVQNNSEIRNLFDSARDMALSGKLASEEGAKQLQSMMSSDTLVSAIDENMTAFRGSFGDVTSNQIIQWRNQIKNYNAETANANDYWTQAINDFNVNIDSLVQGFKMGTVELIKDPRQFIMNMFGEDWGTWLLDGAFNWSIPDTPLVASASEFLKNWLSPLGWVYDSLMGYGSDVGNRFAAIKEPSWENILRAITPKWLSDIILNDEGNIAGADDMGIVLSEKVDAFKESTFAWLDGSIKSLNSYNGTLVEDASATVTSMYDSIGKWWNTPSAQTVIQNSITQSPLKVDNTPIQQPQSNDEMMKNYLSSMLSQKPNATHDPVGVEMIKQLSNMNTLTAESNDLLRKQVRATTTNQMN